MWWNKCKDLTGNIKAVGTLLLMLWAGTVYALDGRYLTLTGYAAGTVQQLQREIAELKHRLLYASTEDKIMLQGLIIIKKQQIKEVK